MNSHDGGWRRSRCEEQGRTTNTEGMGKGMRKVPKQSDRRQRTDSGGRHGRVRLLGRAAGLLELLLEDTWHFFTAVGFVTDNEMSEVRGKHDDTELRTGLLSSATCNPIHRNAAPQPPFILLIIFTQTLCRASAGTVAQPRHRRLP